MKTPKRTAYSGIFNPKYWPFDPPHYAADMLARWKRKNRIALLKRKIAKLTAENEWLSAERKKYIEYNHIAIMELAKMREILISKEHPNS